MMAKMKPHTGSHQKRITAVMSGRDQVVSHTMGAISLGVCIT